MWLLTSTLLITQLEKKCLNCIHVHLNHYTDDIAQ